MARFVNPIHYALIKEFILYLERGNSQCGYIVTNKGNFSASCFNHNVAPKQGEQTIMDIKFCLERISEQDLDTEIKLFLRRKEDPIQLK